MLWVAAGLVLVQGSILLAARDDTARYFSWTIAVPVTAAFLGAGLLVRGSPRIPGGSPG